MYYTHTIFCHTNVNLGMYFLLIIFCSERRKYQIPISFHLYKLQEHYLKKSNIGFFNVLKIIHNYLIVDSNIVFFFYTKKFTCRNPGTSPTAVPSARIQMISGLGLPLAVHSTIAPVVFEKSTRFSGSLINIGPIVVSSSQKTTRNKHKFHKIKIKSIPYVKKF